MSIYGIVNPNPDIKIEDSLKSPKEAYCNDIYSIYNRSKSILIS